MVFQYVYLLIIIFYSFAKNNIEHKPMNCKTNDGDESEVEIIIGGNDI